MNDWLTNFKNSRKYDYRRLQMNVPARPAADSTNGYADRSVRLVFFPFNIFYLYFYRPTIYYYYTFIYFCTYTQLPFWYTQPFVVTTNYGLMTIGVPVQPYDILLLNRERGIKKKLKWIQSYIITVYNNTGYAPAAALYEWFPRDCTND